jgi:hypothetical protein
MQVSFVSFSSKISCREFMGIPIPAVAIQNNSYIGKLLSKNDALHHFGQTSEEWFVGLIRDMHDELQGTALTPQIHEKYWQIAKAKQTLYGEIVATTPVLEMLLKLYPHRAYYARTRIFQPYTLRKTVVGHSGAVS